MAVHAHPGDGAIRTGGVLARHADEGLRTVDVSAQVERKRLAPMAHGSQMGPEVFFARMPPPLVPHLRHCQGCSMAIRSGGLVPSSTSFAVASAGRGHVAGTSIAARLMSRRKVNWPRPRFPIATSAPGVWPGAS